MSLEQIRSLIVEGELLTAAQFEAHREQWLTRGGSADDGAGFVRWLVDEHELTDFQARAILAGIRGPYMLGPYRVTSHLTAGRLGDVYRAEHVEFKQPVSLKVFSTALNRDPEQVARLGREARVALQVDHPHVVKTFQVGRVGDVPFIAFEELHGETLQQRLARDGRLPCDEACQLIQQAALGLAYVHSQEIIHRDICPASLWVSSSGVVKIMEFGAARDALSFIDSLAEEQDPELELTQDSSPQNVLGHYDYMSAQQAENPHTADMASDLYSLGCTFYHCLTGQVPFPDANPVRQMLRHANETPRPVSDFVPEIPQGVEELVSYLLAKNPEDRYGSADEAVAALAYIMPLKAVPTVVTAAPDFLEWVQAVDVRAFAGLPEVDDYRQDFEQFVDWLAEHADEEEPTDS